MDAVRELIRQVGVEGCGGAAGGLEALRLAAKEGHVDVMLVLTEAGVVDTGGLALAFATACRKEASVKFLLVQQQRQEKNTAASDQRAYVNNARDPFDRSPLLVSIGIGSSKLCFHRIVRLLVDSGADTKSAVHHSYGDGLVGFSDTSLCRTIRILRDVEAEGKDDNEEQLSRLEAVRRLLLRVEAVHATSWLWPSSAASIAQGAADVRAGAETESTRLTSTLQLLRHRARRRGVLLRALSRWAVIFIWAMILDVFLLLCSRVLWRVLSLQPFDLGVIPSFVAATVLIYEARVRCIPICVRFVGWLLCLVAAITPRQIPQALRESWCRYPCAWCVRSLAFFLFFHFLPYLFFRIRTERVSCSVELFAFPLRT